MDYDELKKKYGESSEQNKIGRIIKSKAIVAMVVIIVIVCAGIFWYYSNVSKCAPKYTGLFEIYYFSNSSNVDGLRSYRESLRNSFNFQNIEFKDYDLTLKYSGMVEELAGKFRNVDSYKESLTKGCEDLNSSYRQYNAFLVIRYENETYGGTVAIIDCEINDNYPYSKYGDTIIASIERRLSECK